LSGRTPAARLPLERRIYSLIASVTLVLRRGVKTLIAETPSSLCTVGATAYRRKQMNDARRAARVCSRARVVGVAFFDYDHGQTGVAPNAIEFHPVLGFACLS
jgi:hypothetical protein